MYLRIKLKVYHLQAICSVRLLPTYVVTLLVVNLASNNTCRGGNETCVQLSFIWLKGVTFKFLVISIWDLNSVRVLLLPGFWLKFNSTSSENLLKEIKTQAPVRMAHCLNALVWRNKYIGKEPLPVLSLFPSFSLPDVLCDPIDLIWRKRTPFEAMTGRTAPSSDGLLAEVFWDFLGCKANARRSVHSPQDHFIIILIISDRRD